MKLSIFFHCCVRCCRILNILLSTRDAVKNFSTLYSLGNRVTNISTENWRKVLLKLNWDMNWPAGVRIPTIFGRILVKTYLIWFNGGRNLFTAAVISRHNAFFPTKYGRLEGWKFVRTAVLVKLPSSQIFSILNAFKISSTNNIVSVYDCGREKVPSTVISSKNTKADLIYAAYSLWPVYFAPSTSKAEFILPEGDKTSIHLSNLFIIWHLN